jgi:hypothetical protein
MKAPKKKIDRVILAGTGALALLLIGYILFQKTSDVDYYLPGACADKWIVIRYEQGECGTFSRENQAVRVTVSDSCVVCTREKLRIGWNRKRFFVRQPDGSYQQLPNAVADSTGYRMFIHDHDMRHVSHENLLSTLRSGIDTTLFDGARIRKKDRFHVDYTPGRKTVEYFYYSLEAQPLGFTPPGDPKVNTLESTKDRALPLTPP